MRKGFTIIECIVSLLILVMITLLIHLVLPTTMQFQNNSLKNTTDWYLFIERLEDSHNRFQIIKVKNNRLFLVNHDNQEYQVESGKHSIYLRTIHGGYLPILINYQLGSIKYQQLDSRNVYVKAKMADGEQKDAVIHFSKGR